MMVLVGYLMKCREPTVREIPPVANHLCYVYSDRPNKDPSTHTKIVHLKCKKILIKIDNDDEYAIAIDTILCKTVLPLHWQTPSD